ncbi:MFS transporter [Candidatus Woesearchaeota archaeon]|jgi:MFS family permease|nr:MFS transporter [Candidatus Woesearchaeota archaeon]MBT6520279.1 MFS transporter [Candidatus Woesearchaeota archaeon]MBT7367299.1 MFS transporter [Candidatus Woesearchaeota archaeon]
MSLDNITKIKLVYFFRSFFFFSPIITLFYFSRGLDTFQVVSLEAFLILTVLLTEVPTGILADKIGRKYSLILLVGLFFIGNIMTIYSHTYILFIIIQIIFGIAISFGSGAIEALVYDTLKQEKKANLMSKEWGSIQAHALFATVIAVVIGGFIARSHDPKTFIITIWLHLIFSGIALVLALFVKETKHYKQIKRETPLILFKNSAKGILENKSLRKIVYLTVFSSGFAHILMFLFQPYFIDAKVNNTLFGVAMGVGILISAILTKQAHAIEKKLGMKSTLLIFTILPGVLYISMAFLIGPIISFALFILLKGIMDVRQPLLSQYQNNHISSHNRATALSIISMITSLYLVIMRFAMGKLANYNITTTFIVMGSIIIIGSLIFQINSAHSCCKK